jgi:hypothetical protein
VDDPDMSLQSTAALGSSPLHVGFDDGSSSEETPRSPAFRYLMRLSFRSRLAISCFLCCALPAARRLYATILFRLKIASFGRGAFAGTRCVHFNCKNNERASQQSSKVSEKADTSLKRSSSTDNLSKEATTHQFFGLPVGEHRKKPRRRPRKGRLPIANTKRRWISFSDGKADAVMVPV